ncbi:MAG TPA: hypothetical protein VGI98_01815 [Candidatus Limnocylindrales bacterium]|jgi:hypothetical protein
MTDRTTRLGWLGVVADLALALVLGAFVQSLAGGHGLDAVPRSLDLLALYAAPGVVAACGLAGGRRSFVIGAALALVPGSVLSMAGATLVFVVPIVLLGAGAASMGRTTTGRGVEVVEELVTAMLLVGAGIAMLGVTSSGCSASGDVCGSGNLTVGGFAIELGLLAAAIAVAAWRSGLLRGVAGRPAS